MTLRLRVYWASLLQEAEAEKSEAVPTQQPLVWPPIRYFITSFKEKGSWLETKLMSMTHLVFKGLLIMDLPNWYPDPVSEKAIRYKLLLWSYLNWLSRRGWQAIEPSQFNFHPASRGGRGSPRIMGLKNHLHAGNHRICRWTGQRMEVWSTCNF